MEKFNKYAVIKGALNYELANFIFNYFLLKRDAAHFMYNHNVLADIGLFGTWRDQQVPNTYSHYADPVMETLLEKMLPVMKKETDLVNDLQHKIAKIQAENEVIIKDNIELERDKNEIIEDNSCQVCFEPVSLGPRL